MSSPPFAAKPSDDELREKLFQAHAQYASAKDTACYTEWKTGRKFNGCKLNCGCPRSTLISQADVDADRKVRTDQLHSQVIHLFGMLWNMNNRLTLDPLPRAMENMLAYDMSRLMTISPEGAAIVAKLRAGNKIIVTGKGYSEMSD